MARKKSTKPSRKSASKNSHSKSVKRATLAVKRASRDTRKSAKQIARTSKTLASTVKKISKSLAKKQAQKADARELAQINRLLGEEYSSLSSARRALKRESKPVTERTFKAHQNRVVKRARKPPQEISLKYPHPPTYLVLRYQDIHKLRGTSHYEVIATSKFQRAYGDYELKGWNEARTQRDLSARGRFAQSLVDFGYRDEGAEYDVGETPKEEAA